MYKNTVNVNEQLTSAVINKYTAMIPISAKHEHKFLNRNNDTLNWWFQQSPVNEAASQR
jgi:hypothetical protein